MSEHRGPDDGGCRPGDGDLPELPAEFVVPDDPRELAAEAETVRAELWIEERARAQPRVSLSGPLIGLVLMLVAAIGSLVIVVLPYTPDRPTPAPLATPGVAAGRLGGLLPDVMLNDDLGRPVAIREIRPTVMLLMPEGCQCDDVATDLVRVSGETRLPVQLVGADQPPNRPAAAPRDRVFTLSDATGAVSKAVGQGPVAGPVAVLVRANGVIAAVVPGVRDASQLRPELVGLAV
jgi:hypothetical protein